MGRFIFSIEHQVRYILQSLVLMRRQQLSSLEMPQDATDDYNAEIQAISAQLAWEHEGVQSWYKNSAGKVANNSPFSNLEFWSRTHDVEPNRYLGN